MRWEEPFGNLWILTRGGVTQKTNITSPSALPNSWRIQLAAQWAWQKVTIHWNGNQIFIFVCTKILKTMLLGVILKFNSKSMRVQ